MQPARKIQYWILASHFFWASAIVLATDTEKGDSSRTDVALRWTFESSHVGELMGAARISEDGPNGDSFHGLPDFNRALTLASPGAYLRIADDGVSESLDFQLGDPITLETWVRVDSCRPGSQIYLIGKGRTYEAGDAENHNYAMRLTTRGESAKVSFLFSTQRTDGGMQYHRWTSTKQFQLDGNWHHVSISYVFGEPHSIRATLDGQTSSGKWDMGGPTQNPPVVDNDALWIGSSRGGAAGNSLVGALDDVRIHRRMVAEAELLSRRRIVVRPPAWQETADAGEITVTLHESAASHTEFALSSLQESLRFSIPKLALHRLPRKFGDGGIPSLWSGPVLLRAYALARLPAGESEILIRSPGKSRLWIDGELVGHTPHRRIFPDAHQPFVVYEPDLPWLRVPRIGDQEVRVRFFSEGALHRIILESLVGSKDTRCETGETLVAVRQGDSMFTLLGSDGNSRIAQDAKAVRLVDAEFDRYRDRVESILHRLDRLDLQSKASEQDAFWETRHRLARRAVEQTWPVESVAGGGSSKRLESDLTGHPPRELPRLSDLQFLRRVSFDIVGVPPTWSEINLYLAHSPESRRRQAVERLLADDRWADHWTSYWQDVLAENPNILKPSLNNSGPFRIWIHDSLLLNKPMDRFVTELIRMDGSIQAGAPAGFGIATQNDVPLAEKAHVLAGAFLSVDLKCARCHDAPYHPWTQNDLFRIGAMLNNKPLTVPESSSVPSSVLNRAEHSAAIQVTLAPGTEVVPEWPKDSFANSDFGPDDIPTALLGRTNDTRERLAARITRGENRRFAKTMVNRVWARMMGWGLVSSVDDWYESDERLAGTLDQLARKFVLSGYDLKALTRMIAESDFYQLQSIDSSQVAEDLVYAAPWNRRLSAEQVVDSLHSVTGVSMKTEALTFDAEASQRLTNFLNLGTARRAWQLTSLANERDRPSLSLPKAAAVAECLEAFGWRASRQSPSTHREIEPNVIQPALLANSHVTTWITRLTEESETTRFAIQAESPEQLVDQWFLSILTRKPTEEEQRGFAEVLRPGFSQRIQVERGSSRPPARSRGFVTWSNHFDVKANQLMREIESEVAAGPRPTDRLNSDWRERAEDVVWALVNAPEFQLVP